MATPLILPLLPLDGEVLLPGQRLELSSEAAVRAGAWGAAPAGPVAVSLRDDDTVHEIGVIAGVDTSGEQCSLHGLRRCRLLALVQDRLPPMVEVEPLAEGPAEDPRSRRLAHLLHRRFGDLCQQLGHPQTPAAAPLALSPLTWTVVASLGLTPDQQQGFLNVSDPLARGRLLLLAIRELRQRERFLRPWGHLRSGSRWN